MRSYSYLGAASSLHPQSDAAAVEKPTARRLLCKHLLTAFHGSMEKRSGMAQITWPPWCRLKATLFLLHMPAASGEMPCLWIVRHRLEANKDHADVQHAGHTLGLKVHSVRFSRSRSAW